MSATAERSCVLVVEDEWLIAAVLQDQLEDAGYHVIGPAGSVREARAAMVGTVVDAAILDVNLCGETSLVLADELIDGGIPVLLTTGYSARDLPEQFHCCRVLMKPVIGQLVLDALAEAMAP